MTISGYARVSTEDQDYESQIEKLKAEGIDRKNIFHEKMSGARGDRPQLAKLMAAIKPGDTAIVTRLDRPARSTRDLLNTLHEIGQKTAAFKSLADSWADTTTLHGRLLLTILGGLAEFERELIKARTGEGRTRAMANGVKFGRKSKLSPFQRAEAIKRRADGETLSDIARSYGVDVSTISRLKEAVQSGSLNLLRKS